MSFSNTIFILSVAICVAVFLGVSISLRRKNSLKNQRESRLSNSDDTEGLKAAREAYQKSQRSKRRQILMAIATAILFIVISVYQSFGDY